MGLLVMTFESAMTFAFGLFLALWGVSVLVLRARELACCVKFRKEKRERGEDASSCLTV